MELQDGGASVVDERESGKVPDVVREGFTSDNPPLPLLAAPMANRRDDLHLALQSIAADALSSEVARYLTASLASSTLRAYKGDVADFHRWGGSVPCSPMVLARYAADRASSHKVATIARRLCGIGRLHALQGFADPTKSELVRAVLKGVRRQHGGPQHRVRALMRDDLVAMSSAIPSDLRGLRDRAVLLLGFASAMRRSELVALDVEDLYFVAEGLLLRLRRSKTDQTALGRTVAVESGRTVACPVAAVKAWLEAASLRRGALFTRVTKSGSPLEGRLTPQSVALIVKARVAAAGFPSEAYSGHSLRAGLVTSAARMGLSAEAIQRQTGHKSAVMVARYVRQACPFDGHPAGAVL